MQVTKKKAATVLVMGASGNLGRQLVDLLIQHRPELSLLLGGRELSKVGQMARELGELFPSSNIKPVLVDTGNPKTLRQPFRQADLIVVASSSTKDVDLVAKEALKAGADYFDGQMSSPEKLKFLYRYAPKIKRKGRCFITDGGFHPGLPGAMIRWGEKKATHLLKANVYCALRPNWKDMDFSRGTEEEFIRELRHFKLVAFKNGCWRKMSFTDIFPYNFGPPYGKLDALPMGLEEVRLIPESNENIKETGFYVTGFNWVFDYLVSPLLAVTSRLRLFSGINQHLLRWSLSFSKPPFGVKLALEAEGNGEKFGMNLATSDPYFLTAAPMVATISQYLNGKVEAGLHLQGLAVEPLQFFADLKMMGVEMHEWGTNPSEQQYHQYMVRS